MLLRGLRNAKLGFDYIIHACHNVLKALNDTIGGFCSYFGAFYQLNTA